MIKAKNEQDLLSILRIISSEAVGLSRKMNENADPTASKFIKQYREDENMYGSLSEQEDEEPPTDEPAAEEPSEEPKEEPEPSSDSGTVGASFDSVVQAVNNLRAGKSLRDSSIKQQAQVYYDKLTEDERTTLLVFLDALSNIIAGQVDGKDAQDPSDPPSSIKITSGEESEEVTQVADTPNEDTPEEDTPEEDAPEEDNTPPIKVNESQDVLNLRKRVRRIMLRG